MHVKSILHEFGTCKIDFTYIRYYLAAKIDFTGFPILAAPDPRQEALQGKTGQYAILGHGEEVTLGVEELCGHLHETIAIKGAWISASTMTLWHHFHSTSDSESPKLGPAWPV